MVLPKGHAGEPTVNGSGNWSQANAALCVYLPEPCLEVSYVGSSLVPQPLPQGPIICSRRPEKPLVFCFLNLSRGEDGTLQRTAGHTHSAVGHEPQPIPVPLG